MACSAVKRNDVTAHAPGWTLKMLSSAKEASLTRPHAAWFRVYRMFKMGKSIERQEIGGRPGGGLRGARFLFWNSENVLEVDSVDACKTQWVYRMSQKATFTSCVLYHNKKKKKSFFHWTVTPIQKVHKSHVHTPPWISIQRARRNRCPTLEHSQHTQEPKSWPSQSLPSKMASREKNGLPVCSHKPPPSSR